MRKNTLLAMLFFCTLSFLSAQVYRAEFTDNFEDTDAYPEGFMVLGQQAWGTFNDPRNLLPYTGDFWNIIYCNAALAQKTYSVQIADEERTGGVGSKSLQLNITNESFSAATNPTVRLRTLLNFPADVASDEYKISFWARVDGTTKPVFKENGNVILEVSSTWTQYTLNRFRSSATATDFQLDFVKQADGSDYVVYLDDVTILKKDLGTDETSLSDFKSKSALQVFPNPVQSVIHFNVPEPVKSVQIYNVNGQKIKEEKVNEAMLEVSSLSQGVYFIKAESETRNYYTSFFKE